RADPATWLAGEHVPAGCLTRPRSGSLERERQRVKRARAGQSCLGERHEPLARQLNQQVVEVVIRQAADVGGELKGAVAHAVSPPVDRPSRSMRRMTAGGPYRRGPVRGGG